jgi:hypothetical protein
MGGFMEYEGNRPIRVLLPDQLKSYSLTGNGDLPRISKAEIDDRSKGDTFSKGFVILQTGWFVTQCVVRGVQGLPITELELVTVAFAALNFVIFLLWWEKPLNVQRGVRVYKKRETKEPKDDGDVEANVRFWVAFRDALSSLPAAIVRGPLVKEFGHMSWLLRVLSWPILKPLEIFGGENQRRFDDFRRVDTFYPGKWVKTFLVASRVTVTAIASTFGGIHCIGSLFTFPTRTEQTLWRIASVSITFVPIMYILFITVKMPHGYQIPDLVILTFLLPHLFLYILCRLVLLVLPLMCLRSLPLASYHIVRWTSVIPHV